MSAKLKVVCVAGARPNFMKIAPILKAVSARSQVESLLVHTGQHYDARMSDLFFVQLKIPPPDINLGICSGSAIYQMAEMMKAFEIVCLEQRPDAVLVVGDVNSTIACGMTAVKNGIKLIHVEAGLRSFDRSMPEEINRILTDSISDLLFVSEPSGLKNLASEGVPASKVFLVGNVMIDSLVSHLEHARSSHIRSQLGVENQSYCIVTLHRPGNVDDKYKLTELVNTLESVQERMKVVFPIHPRTSKQLERFDLVDKLASMRNLLRVEPLGYIEFLSLMMGANFILTDSGGVQEESTYLKIPCITVRESTERPITVEIGSNQLVGINHDAILNAIHSINTNSLKWSVPEMWDGKSAVRIVDTIIKVLS